MTRTTKMMIAGAALGGLLAGASTRAMAATAPAGSGKSIAAARQTSEFAGKKADGFADEKPKNSCKGKNECKGKGGCKSSDNGCKGKNSCKGKGGCANDKEKEKGK